jgi:predicted double-glycine peptidase
VRVSNATPRLLLALLLALMGCVSGPHVSDRPVSYLALRYEATVPQHKEFTCGAASVATILTYYWNAPTSETRALQTLKVRYTEAQLHHISETGLSFDDLIFMANELGFSAEGAKVTLNQLPSLAGPVIVHLDKGVFKHFAVLRKTGDGVYYVSDPIVGQLTMHADEFEQQYTGYVLAIWKEDASLPLHSILNAPRDGIRVSDSLRRAINVPDLPLSRGF